MRAKTLFFIVKYANFSRQPCRPRRRGCLSFLVLGSKHYIPIWSIRQVQDNINCINL